MTGETRFHSVILDEAECKGCTVCVTTCPAEAIRVRGGKARILAERCIDCGECIRRCPNHAKKASADRLADLTGEGRFADYDARIALPAPSLYGQFPPQNSVADIHRALKSLGFDAVFPVAAATPAVAHATRMVLEGRLAPELGRPIISSSCPTIIKLIQIRFPTLLSHVAPIVAPMETAGRLARRAALERYGADARIACLFISPCAGKITEALAPLGGEPSAIEGVLSMGDLLVPLKQALARQGLVSADTYGDAGLSGAELGWGRAGGEAEAVAPEALSRRLSADGMAECIGILEAAENGKLRDIDFLELMACPNGCVGGPLVGENPVIARHSILERERLAQTTARPAREEPLVRKMEADLFCLRKTPFPARSALLLDPDFKTARRMMESMEAIFARLPGLDCGCCGAPHCHALAEDIVRGNASETDCVIILKEQYRELLKP